MIAPVTLFIIVMLYVLLLFGVAYFAEVREASGRSLVNNPYVYSLSLAVYCTSWTFYGSVGRAATSGLMFLPIYLGPTIMLALWPVVLKKVVKIAKANRITTISDFISFRYGKSLALSVLVTVVAVIGITPYLGLQIKAILSTIIIFTGKGELASNAGVAVTILLGLFIIMFGIRRLDLSERHGGIVFAIALESLVKLVAFLLVGIFVTWHLFDGLGDILSRTKISGNSYLMNLLGTSVTTSYSEWFAMTFLSMLAIVFLPRQFHMAVVENNDESHIDKAAWLFPLYLLLINIFVLPIAFGGLLLTQGGQNPDYFVLTLPLDHGSGSLAIFAFIGGFSAATGMLIVEVLAISTMVMNSIVMPVIYKFHGVRGFSTIVLNIKRLVVIVIVFLGYLFSITVGAYESLAALGLKSFEAVALFAPPLIIGLYWKRCNKYGAFAGLCAGFLIWLYASFVPPLINVGVIDKDSFIGIMAASHFFNPTALFGVWGMGKTLHTIFWSMLAELIFFFGVSLATRQSKEEEMQSLLFVESYEVAPVSGHSVSYVIEDIENILGRYMGADEVQKVIEGFLGRKNKDRSELFSSDLIELRTEAEKMLAGSIGPSLSSIVFEDRFVLTEADKVEIAESIERVTESLRLSRQELSDANQELERSNRELQQFAYVASHDLQEPLRKVVAFGDRLKTNYADVLDERGVDYLERMQNAALRMRHLIEALLAYSRVSTTAGTMAEVSLAEVVHLVLSDLDHTINECGAEVVVGELPQIKADRLQIGQLLQNLISNAIKYRKPDGQVKVAVSSFQQPGSSFVEIQVKDNGIGFDEKYLDRIFAPFQRLHSRQEYSGTGIGLAICKKIVERHGGTITARSAPDEGALFLVTLPLWR